MPRPASVWFTERHGEQVVDAVGNRFVGHQVAVFDRGDVAEGLLKRGGVPGRLSLEMTLDLSGRLPAASAVSIGPLATTRTAEYGAVSAGRTRLTTRRRTRRCGPLQRRAPSTPTSEANRSVPGSRTHHWSQPIQAVA
jgi:hypothetical protein